MSTKLLSFIEVMKKPLRKNTTPQIKKWAFVAAVVACVCVLLYIVLPQPNPLREMLDLYAIQTTKFSVSRTTDSTGFRFYSTVPMKERDVIFTLPRNLCVTYDDVTESPIGEALKEFSGEIDEALTASGSMPSFKYVLSFALYLAFEKRNPLSNLQAWFQNIPDFTRRSGALYWTDKDVDCLDPSGASEARIMRFGFDASVTVAKSICGWNPDVCPGGPPTKEELRWSLTAYFHFNIRDQVVVPVFSFARFGSKSLGMDVQMNREGGLNIVAKTKIAVGEELFVYFPRGPSTQIVSRGSFDTSALGVDASLNLGQEVQTPQGKRFCINHVHELMFGSNGRPRDALLTCVSWLLATHDERKQFDNHRANKPLYQRTVRKLLQLANESLAATPITCDSSPELANSFNEYRSFVRKVLKANLEHLASQL